MRFTLAINLNVTVTGDHVLKIKPSTFSWNFKSKPVVSLLWLSVTLPLRQRAMQLRMHTQKERKEERAYLYVSQS